jgi:hypothetical protein
MAARGQPHHPPDGQEERSARPGDGRRRNVMRMKSATLRPPRDPEMDERFCLAF